MKAFEQYFPVLLFLVLYKVVLTFEFVDKILLRIQMKAIQMKATEQYFPVVLFIIMYKVVLTFEFQMKAIEQYFTVIQVGSNFWICGWNPKVWPFKWKLSEQYFPVVLFIMLFKVALTFEIVDKIVKCDESDESYWAVLPCGAVHYAIQCGWNLKGPVQTSYQAQLD